MTEIELKNFPAKSCNPIPLRKLALYPSVPYLIAVLICLKYIYSHIHEYVDLTFIYSYNIVQNYMHYSTICFPSLYGYALTSIGTEIIHLKYLQTITQYEFYIHEHILSNPFPADRE